MSKIVYMQETFDLIVQRNPDTGKDIYEKGTVKEINTSEYQVYRYLLIQE